MVDGQYLLLRSFPNPYQQSITTLDSLPFNKVKLNVTFRQVREWLPYNGYSTPEMVSPKTCQWSVPTVKRLWFGTNMDDKQRRLRAFLSCLNSGIRSYVIRLQLAKTVTLWRLFYYADCHSGRGILFLPCPQKTGMLQKIFL